MNARSLVQGLVVLAILSVSTGAILVGCSKPEPGTPEADAQHKQQVALVKAASTAGVMVGLKTWGKDHPAEATEAATALSKNIREVIVPYLTSQGPLLASSEVQAFLESSLFTNVNPIIKDSLVAASAILDALLPVPSADKLSPHAQDFILAFVQGAEAGCNAFLRPVVVAPRGPTAVWIK